MTGARPPRNAPPCLRGIELMRTLRPCAALLALAVVAPGLSPKAAAQTAPQTIGAVSAVMRQAQLSNARAPHPHQVAPREQVALADAIQTGNQSQLQLLLLDRSVFSIGANARLTIDRFVYDPAQGRSVGATVAKGAFRFMSGTPNHQQGSSIATPVATIGIRGTIVEGVIGPEAIAIVKAESIHAATRDADKANAALIVLRGPGDATQGDAQPGAITVATGGGTVDVMAPMLAVFVPRAGAAPVGPFELSRAGLLRLREDIFPALATGNGGKTLQTLLGVGLIAAGVLGGGGGDQQTTTTPAKGRNGP